jgi:hypothetical protein
MDWVNRTKPAYIEDINKYPIPLPADMLEPLVSKKEPPVKTKGGNRMVSHFSYNSVQTHSTMVDGHTTEVTESTRIKNGKGVKTVRYFVKPKYRSSMKKRNGAKVISKTLPLTSTEIKNIQTRKFMPSLFAECHASAKPTQSEPINRFFHKGCTSETRKVKRRTKKHSK